MLINHAHKLKLASLVHGGGRQELERLLDFGRVGVEGGGEGLEFGGRLVVVVYMVKV